MTHKINREGVAVDHNSFWRPMHTCPHNTTVLLLNPGRIPVRGKWDGKDTDWLAWYPYPKYDPDFKFLDDK